MFFVMRKMVVHQLQISGKIFHFAYIIVSSFLDLYLKKFLLGEYGVSGL